MISTIDARYAVSLDADGPDLPKEIQWMPPGKHRIHAKKNGQPATVSVNVDASGASAVDAEFRRLIEAGKAPYIDYKHDNGAASARVAGVRWGGDDPKTGGIRLVIANWTDRGAQAVKSKEFTHFSPTFRLDEKTGRVVGTTTNMGGLVNDPAFTSISPVTARENTDTMSKLLTALAAAKLITSAELADDEAAAQFTAAFAPFTAAQAELETTKGSLAKIEAKLSDHAKRHAESLVEAAAQEGRIPAKDADARSFWVTSLITAGESAEKALKSLPVNPVLREIVKVEASAAAAGSDSAANNAKERDTKIAEYRASRPAASFQEAWDAAATAHPDLFRA